jgi:hypothetical protein
MADEWSSMAGIGVLATVSVNYRILGIRNGVLARIQDIQDAATIR